MARQPKTSTNDQVPFTKDAVTTVIQAVVGGATLALGLAYVFINAAYIHFYEEFGVQPEQIGLNRLNILARTAGIVLAIAVLVFFPAMSLPSNSRLPDGSSVTKSGGRAARRSPTRMAVANTRRTVATITPGRADHARRSGAAPRTSRHRTAQGEP